MPDRTPPPATPTGFGSLGLDDAIVASVTALGYEEPTLMHRTKCGCVAPIDSIRCLNDCLNCVATPTNWNDDVPRPVIVLVRV
jgi:hypothetical protein